MKQLKINDSVSWVSAAGYLEGTIANIILSLNGKKDLVPWIDIEVDGKQNIVRLCALEFNLKMLKLKLI